MTGRLRLTVRNAARLAGGAACALVLLAGPSASATAADAEDCRNAELLLETDADRLVAACTRLAEEGAAWAQFRLGWLYDRGDWLRERGTQLKADPGEAVRWYREAAEQGDAEAQMHLGSLYLYGVGVPQDAGEAEKWVRRAAEKGNPEAQHNMGTFYIGQDDAEAVRWYRMAAEQGIGYSQSIVGTMYADGRGVEQSHAEAERWFRKAAEQDVAEAQNNLGILYGRAVPPDNVRALAWFDLAAADGYPGSAERRDRLAARMTTSEIEAAHALAREWETDFDAPGAAPTVIGDVEDCARADFLAQCDPDRGAAACLRLAEHGNPYGQLSVGIQYFAGLGVPRDAVRAYMWISLGLAPLQGPDRETAAMLLDTIADEITPSELEEARRLAERWKPEVDR